MRVFLSGVVLFILLMIGSVSCAADPGDSTDTIISETTNYEITVVVENQIVLVEATDPGYYNGRSLAAGIEKVAETYVILEVIPITRVSGYGSATAAAILMVEPLK